MNQQVAPAGGSASIGSHPSREVFDLDRNLAREAFFEVSDQGQLLGLTGAHIEAVRHLDQLRRHREHAQRYLQPADMWDLGTDQEPIGITVPGSSVGSIAYQQRVFTALLKGVDCLAFQVAVGVDPVSSILPENILEDHLSLSVQDLEPGTEVGRLQVGGLDLEGQRLARRSLDLEAVDVAGNVDLALSQTRDREGLDLGR